MKVMGHFNMYKVQMNVNTITDEYFYINIFIMYNIMIFTVNGTVDVI